MATVISDEIRSALKANGVWHDFVRRRDDARKGGLGATAANRRVVAEFVAEGKLPEGTEQAVRPRGRPAGSGGGRKRATADVRAAAKDARMSAEADGAEALALPKVTRETFAGKGCSISAAFLWAYSNLSFADVDPSEAPSAVAWQMLADMRTSPSLKSEMLRSGLGAAMRKAEAEDETNGRFDGEGEYDLLEALAKGGAE